MSPRAVVLLVGFSGLVLWLWSRTRTASVSIELLTDDVLEFVDVSASRVKSALQSRGYRNNNPGNIRFIVRNPWNGQIGDDGGYGIYETPRLGTRALGKQLLAYSKAGRRTVRDIVATWAPVTENNTNAYIADVARQLNVEPDQVIDVDARLEDLARAIARHENGYLDASYDFHNWVRIP